LISLNFVQKLGLVDENQRDQLIEVEDDIKRNAEDGDWDAAYNVRG